MKSLAACLLLVGTAPAEPPLIEQFRLDLTPAEVLSGEALQARSVATQAYLYQLPSFLHLRQLGEFIQGREYIIRVRLYYAEVAGSGSLMVY